MYPPPAAFASVARHAPRASGSYTYTKKIFSAVLHMNLNSYGF